MGGKTRSMAAAAGAEGGGAEACDFRCLHRSARGRVFHCPEIRRVVIDFAGACLVLRPWELHRLHLHLARILACGMTRSRLAGGERIRLRDATGEKALILDLDGLEELADLMESGTSRLEFPTRQGVAESLGADPIAKPFPAVR